MGLVQYTDAHSSTETIAQQLAAIDHLGQIYLQRNPGGEFVVHVIGDFTSINAYSDPNRGWQSYLGLRRLAERGYRVLFTPGNHDAFDWSGNVNGAQLFEEQMKALNQWGITVVVGNMTGMNDLLSSFVVPYVELPTLETKTLLFGLALPNFYNKANVDRDLAARVFTGIETYEESLARVEQQSLEQQAEKVILAAHDGHIRLAKKVEVLNHMFAEIPEGPEVILGLAAHDHLVASYVHAGALILDGGSHGSFNYVELDQQGEILLETLAHISMEHPWRRLLEDGRFEVGQFIENDVTVQDVLGLPWWREYQELVHRQREVISQVIDQPVGLLLQEISEHRVHMRVGPTDLGTWFADAMALWAKDQLPSEASAPIVAMMNSGSYAMESTLPAGVLTEGLLRQMYIFHNEVTLYALDGQTIEVMYLSLREFYSQSDQSRYSPQVNSLLRETETGQLEIQDTQGQWGPLEMDREYYVVLDGRLSEHRSGQSYRIPEWLEALRGKEPLAALSQQELIVNYVPQVLESQGLLVRALEDSADLNPSGSVLSESLGGMSCNGLF